MPFATVTASAAAGVWAWTESRALMLSASVALGFFAGGAILAIDSWHRAWRPSLRIAFEELAREQREQALRAGRGVPEDEGAFATLTGVLRADASPRPDGGASISLDVRSVDVPRPDPLGRASSEVRGPEVDVRRPDLLGRASSDAPGPDVSGRAARSVRGGVLLTVSG